MDTLIVFSAKYLLIGVVSALAYVWLKAPRQQKIEMTAVVIVAGVLALIVSRLAGMLYYDPRPFVAHNVKALIPHAADNGFPSDHALLTMTIATALYFYNKKWAGVALLFTLVVSGARVLAHIHSPIDIIGAWAIGIAAAVVAWYALRAMPWFKRYSEEPKTTELTN